MGTYTVITHVAECLMDISFVVDYSGSIRDHNPPGGPDNWNLIINFMVKVVSSLNVGQTATHVGAVSFGTQSKLSKHFVSILSCCNSVNSAVDRWSPRVTTNAFSKLQCIYETITVKSRDLGLVICTYSTHTRKPNDTT